MNDREKVEIKKSKVNKTVCHNIRKQPWGEMNLRLWILQIRLKQSKTFKRERTPRPGLSRVDLIHKVGKHGVLALISFSKH